MKNEFQRESDLPTIRMEELQRRAEAFAEAEFLSVRENDRRFLYYRNAEDAKAAFRQNFMEIMAPHYIVLPPAQSR